MTRARYATDESLRNLLGTEESETLEFKREVWSDGKEAAKDVAAMANAWGGEILIGVAEGSDGSRASAFAMTLAADGREREGQRIHQLLEHYLRPRDFVDRLRFSWLTAPLGETVLAIWVPAAARACMAVAHEEGRKGARFQFPVRAGRETRFMEYDEVLSRMADASRATSLKLKELRTPSRPYEPFSLASPIVKLTSGGPRRLLRTALDHDGSLGEEYPHGVALNFAATYAWGTCSENLNGRSMVLPYALVRTLWRDVHGVVWIALDGQVESFGQALQVCAK